MQSTIDVKEAVRQAKETLTTLYEDDPPQSLALEGIELVKQSNREMWAVTLGFHRRKSVTSITGGGFGNLGLQLPSQVEHRVYKTLYVDATTGEFVKMEIRSVQ